MKKIIIMLCSVLSFMQIPVVQAQEDVQEDSGFAQNAKAAYVMEYSTSSEVYSKNGDEPLYPASMTKMMSLLLVYEAIDKGVIAYDDEVVASAHAASMGGSQVYLEEGEVMLVEDLLKAVIISSGNDAIVALAEKVAGSEANFVREMNEKATALGLENTKFMNSSGLHDDNHYSSAKDMAIIAQTLIQVGGEDLLAVSSTYEDYIREDSEEKFWLVNTNKLLRQYEGVDGLKTGYTSQAMSCITTTAYKDGMRFIVVLMGEPETTTRNAEAIQLLDYSFSKYTQQLLYEAGSSVDTLAIDYAKDDSVELLVQEDVYIVHEKGEEVSVSSKDIDVHKNVEDFTKGGEVASLTLHLSDGSTQEVALVSDRDVALLGFWDIVIQSAKFVLF